MAEFSAPYPLPWKRSGHTIADCAMLQCRLVDFEAIAATLGKSHMPVHPRLDWQQTGASASRFFDRQTFGSRVSTLSLSHTHKH